MEHVDRRNEQWHIIASSSLIYDDIKVLKQGDTFGLFDRNGDIHSLRTGSHGLYHEGTRFLSRFELTMNGERPLLL
ncbi:MAG TPA: glycogen debranching N-terminal domain-containing protein, partial [Nitrospiraceae bacterium]|nr:glycogen debranching N-terminal domain-containing protein [Nitrospiraceae bacterium]